MKIENSSCSDRAHQPKVTKSIKIFIQDTHSFKLIKTYSSIKTMQSNMDVECVKKVLVLYTGGTIGMAPNENNGEL